MTLQIDKISTSYASLKEVNISFTSFWCTLSLLANPTTSEQVGDFQKLESALDEAFMFHPEGYYFSPQYQSRVWDGYTHLYHTKTHRFRAGVLFRVLALLEKEGIKGVVSGFPEAREFKQQSKAYTLRPYQLKAVQDICTKRFGILQSPMRSGKTMICIACFDSERLFPAVFFCRSLDLAYQTIARVKQFLPDISVGLVGDGEVDIQDITIITIQSAFEAFKQKPKDYDIEENDKALVRDEEKAKVRKLITDAQIIFYDENHHSGAYSSRYILDRCKSVQMRIGLSATPFEGDSSDWLVEEAMGTVIHKISYSELIREGFILRPYIYMYKLPSMNLKGIAYPSVYKAAVTNNEYLTGLIVKLVHTLTSQGNSVVVQTEFIEHSKKLAKAIGGVLLTGKERDMEVRKEVLRQLREKEILCVVSTLFEEGIDTPSLDFTINVAGGLTNIGTLQKMRSITAAEGKETCGIIDFYHQCEYLERHSQTRRDIYLSEPEFVFEERDVSDMTLEEIVE
jgi:superfamily II DNA or RNA helicase